MNEKMMNRERRDRELLEAYEATLQLLLPTKSENAKSEALHFALRNWQPHYCVSFSHAYRLVCALLSGRTFEKKGPLRQAMWREIAERVRQITERNPVSRAKALDFVLQHCRATRFYISDTYARNHLVTLLRARKSRVMQLASKTHNK